MRYSAELVLKVNEVFHDVEGPAYAGVHPEIFHGEAERWDRVARDEIATLSRPIRVLDVGCGTGFVAERVAPLLSSQDEFVCSDLSQKMLDACRGWILQRGLACRFEFVKLEGKSLPLQGNSCDVITMNSVLHHLPEPAAVLRDVDRVLKLSGKFIVAHEPNRRFYQSPSMRTRASVFSPKQTVGAMLRRVGLMKLAQRVRRGHNRAVLDEVNRRLMSAGAISNPLTQDELTAIVDINSPTAGGFHADRGIDIEALAAQHLPNFECKVESYDHLGSGADARVGPLLSRYAKRIASKRPKDGATLLAILTKKPD
jgi:ubiquinone/menaquinone biosynthesis C-methylase UbiE